MEKKGIKACIIACNTATAAGLIKAKKFFEENGIKMIEMNGLNIQPDVDTGKEFPNTSYQLAKKINKDNANAIFISCTDFRTFEVIELLEKELKKPVLTSNQVFLWHGLRLSGIPNVIPGLGKIFLEGV